MNTTKNKAPTITYLSIDTIVKEDLRSHKQWNTEFLKTINPSGMPPHRLELKINSIVILIRNINRAQGLCNGTRLIITKLGN